MKKTTIRDLIKLEFVIFIGIILIVTNLILFTDYLGVSALYSTTSMMDSVQNVNSPQYLKYNAEDPSIKIKAATSKADKQQKRTEPSYLSYLEDAPTDKIDKELKKKISKKKRSKKKYPEDKIKVIVEVKGEESLDPVSDIIEENGGDVEGKFKIGDSIIANVPITQIDELAANEDVEGLWDDREYNMLLDTSIPQINVPSAWNLGYDGAGIKIAVLDTGIDDSNEMLSGKIIAAEVFTGEDHTIDKEGHGTHIAGVIAGNGQYRGVAPEALLMNAKVLTDSGSGTTSTIIQGINWAVENGADIISMSLGAPYNDPDGPVNAALKDAIDAGVVVVVSAGNCGQDCPSGSCGSFRGVTNPSDFKDAIAVGAVDKENNWACFSSGQEFTDYIKPDLVAPGVDITSSFLGNGYDTLSGTSMSAPFVAGIAALMLQKNSSLNQSSLKSLLENSAIDLGVEGKDVKFGSGLVDVQKLFLIDDNEVNITPIINDTNEYNETQNQTQNNIYKNLLIVQDIGKNWFIGKNEFSEPDHAFYGAMADYQNEELYKIKVGVLEFENDVYLNDFLDQNIVFTNKSLINSQELYFTQKDDYWFWISGNRFVWVLTPMDINDEIKLIFKEYLQKYSISAQYELKQIDDTESFDVQEFNDLIDNNIEYGDSYISNAYCTDKCDPDSYKTDLSSGTCHNGKNYVKKGTTYNDERGWTHTDKCEDSSTVKEYFMKCDYNSFGWCPTQGFFCLMDETFFTVKNCASTFGSDYVCSNGACVSSCDYSPSCSQSSKRECYSTTSYHKYDAYTKCEGSCGYDFVDNFNCGGGNYCSGTEYDGTKPCYSCSTASDGVCQSKNCFGYDPDCKSDGGVYECSSDSQCGSNQRCVSNQCVDKTCEEMGYERGSCSTLDDPANDGQCIDGSNGDVYECKAAGNKQCWQKTIDCQNNEICEDPLFSAAQCKLNCVSHSSKACSSNDVYWYDSCGNREEVYDDCQSPAAVCTTDSGGGRYYDGNCRISDATCQYNQFDQCNDCSSGSCAFSCDLSSATWSTSSATEGDTVTLTVNGDSDCNGKTASFNIWEKDCLYDYSATVDCTDEGVNNNPSSDTFSNGKAETTWTAEWQNDGIGDPEYYFIAKVDSETKRSNSPESSVLILDAIISAAAFNERTANISVPNNTFPSRYT